METIPGYTLIEKEQALLPVNGLPPVMGALSGSSVLTKPVRAKRSKGGSAVPPCIQCTPIITHTFRYYANATATNVNINIGNLLTAMGVIGTIANSTVVSFCSSVRVRKISIWSGAVSTGAVNAEVVWEGLSSVFTKDDSKEATVPKGITVERVLVTRPPAGTLCSFWLNSSSGSNVAFQITCESGSVIDVVLQGTLGNNLANFGVGGYAAVALGTVYYGRLDGQGGKLQPLGLPSTN